MNPLLFAAILNLAGPQAPSAADIRKIDFQDFTYEPWCTHDRVTVKNGEFERQSGDDRMFFRVMRVAYGDANGDGREDALVLTVCNTGGTGNFSDAYVFSTEGGRAVLLAHLDGGDRADGGFGDIEADRGSVVIERYVNEGGGACCPEYV